MASMSSGRHPISIRNGVCTAIDGLAERSCPRFQRRGGSQLQSSTEKCGYCGRAHNHNQCCRRLSLLDITPGRYLVSAAAQGFAEQRVPEFTLTVGQAATIDFVLGVGSQTTEVTVHGVTPQLETSSANLGKVVETKQVNDLPLNGRDFTHLLTLTPGVSPVNNGQGGPQEANMQRQSQLIRHP